MSDFIETATFQKALNVLKVFESKGLKFKITVGETVFESEIPIEPPKPLKRTRTFIERPVKLVDLFRDQINNLNVADVAVLSIPSEYIETIDSDAWRKAISSYAVKRFGTGACSTTASGKHVEVLREK